MQSKQFVQDILYEIRKVCDQLETESDEGNHAKPNGRVLMEELSDLTTILTNPSMTQRITKTTTNGFIHKNFQNLVLDDMPNMIQLPDEDIVRSSIIKHNFEQISSFINSNEIRLQNDGFYRTFMVEDLIGFMKDNNLSTDTIIEITELYILPSFRRKGYGTEAIRSTIVRNGRDKLYCIANQVYKYDYPEKPDDEISEKVIKENHMFLVKNGFVNINELVGYEFKDAYLYIGNDIGKQVFNLLVSTGRITK